MIIQNKINVKVREDLLGWLEEFYNNLCDGDWEHSYGMKIDTLDNPGWSIEIDLAETYLEKRSFKDIKIDRSDIDWIYCRLEDNKFKMSCGSRNIYESIGKFKNWVEENTD